VRPPWPRPEGAAAPGEWGEKAKQIISMTLIDFQNMMRRLPCKGRYEQESCFSFVVKKRKKSNRRINTAEVKYQNEIE
jgi:hypothetical protein